jgi:hypothetical protein
MKLVLKKDMAAERTMARARLDDILVPRINEMLGPKAALYALKYAAALAGAAPDAEAIIANHEAATAAVMTIEDQRQALQARIENAATVFDLEEILAEAASA